MIPPALLVHWTRDKDGVGCWKVEEVDKDGTNIGASRFHTKIEALEYANERFKRGGWVLLTVLNRDGSQDHCTSKFEDGPLWGYLLTHNKLGGRNEKQSSCEVRTAS